jgi:hypothetical protein
MKIFFVPNHKNHFRAHLLTKPALIIFAIGIFLFNSFVPVNISAQNSSIAINVENLLNEHNKLRKEQNLGELKLNSNLMQSAQKKADAMLASDCWAHYCPNGKSPWDFFDEAGYNYVLAGENLAEGFYNINEVSSAWKNSKTHKDNILKGGYSEVGFGIAYGKFQNNSNNIIIVVHFGSRGNVAAATSEEKRELSITSPGEAEVIKGNTVDIKGTSVGYSQVDVIANNIDVGTGKIGEGIFTYRLENLSNGLNSIYVKGFYGNNLFDTSKVVSFNAEIPIDNLLFVNDTSNLNLNNQIIESGFSVSSTTKNIINLGFVFFLAMIFLVDFIVLSRTQVLKGTKSYSHYHFSIFLILGIIIIAGGFAGQISSGITF